MSFLVIKMPFKNHLDEIGIKGISIRTNVLENAKKQASDSSLSAGTVAHDIKNDIHSLGLNAEKASWLMNKLSTEKILEKSSLSPRDVEFLYEYPQANLKTKTKMTQTVDASLAHLQEVITGNYAAVSEDYEVYPILSLVKEAVESYAHHREVPFIHLQHIKDFEFFGSYQLVSKIVGNLFNNALRQMDKYGQGEIFINSIENEHFYILKIKDTAGHISQERINELFTAYKTGNVAGTGFGLSSAKLFMERMGGDIQAKLIETDKIEFELYFPKLDDSTLELGMEED
jgi:signal transduction histidine kinase